MNKKTFILPLMTTTLLFGCGKNDPTPEVKTYTVNIISKGSELHPDKEIYTFKEDVFTPFEVTFSGSDLYCVQTLNPTIEGAADIDIIEENKVRITPLINHDFDIIAETALIQYDVTFHADDFNKIVGHEEEDEVTITCNKKDSWGVIKTKIEVTTGFAFNGWSTYTTGFGPVISDDYQIVSNMDVYPSNDFKVDVISDGKYVIDDFFYDEEAAYIYFHFKIVDDIHYEFAKECYISIKIGDNKVEDITSYVDYKNRTIKFSIDDIKGNIRIVINPYQPTYTVTSIADPDNHMEYFFYGDLNKPRKGNDFSFDLRVSNLYEKPDIFTVPDTLQIKIGGKELLDGYKIIPDPDYPEIWATVVIEGKHVNGDIEVYGEAKKTDCFNYNIHNFGTVVTKAEGEGELKTTGVSLTNATFSFKIKGSTEETVTYDSNIKDENILVNIDGGENDWTTVEKEEEKGSYARFRYDEENHIFTLNEKTTHNLLEIYIRNPDEKYKFLEDICWEQVAAFSNRGIAKYLLYVGEEKAFIDNTITTDGMHYTARIIGFDHDDLLIDGGKKAGITFEITNVICDSKGNAINKAKVQKESHGKIYHFKETQYNTYLNNDYFENIQSDLRTSIKEIKKKAIILSNGYKTEFYETKLFPIGCNEMVGNFAYKDGDIYEYYKQNKDKKFRIKTDLRGNKKAYWSRTNNPYGGRYGLYSYVINGDGDSHGKHNKDDKSGYTAAFCI